MAATLTGFARRGKPRRRAIEGPVAGRRYPAPIADQREAREEAVER